MIGGWPLLAIVFALLWLLTVSRNVTLTNQRDAARRAARGMR